MQVAAREAQLLEVGTTSGRDNDERRLNEQERFHELERPWLERRQTQSK